MSAFLNSLNPEFSGEVWLSLNDPKKKKRAVDENDAVSKGRAATVRKNHTFVQHVSLEVLCRNGDWHEILGVSNLDIDYCRSRNRYDADVTDEPEESREEHSESLLARCPLALSEMLELMGKSFSTLFSYSRNISKSGSEKAFNVLMDRIVQAHANGKSQQEIFVIVEKYLGKYFPAVAEKHAKQKVAAEARVPTRVMRNAQQELFADAA